MSDQKPHVPEKVKITVLVGIYLVRILDITPWVWGNLSVYIMSYYVAVGDTLSASRANAMITVNTVGFCSGILIGNPIIKKFGILPTLFTAIVTCNVGKFLTFYAVKDSAITLCVVFGIIPGLAEGVVEACQLVLVVRWTNRYKGLATSSVTCIVTLAAVVMNLVFTVYINPENKVPNSVFQHMKIFLQPDVIDRVPSSFIVFGIMSFGLNLIGFVMIREWPGQDNIFLEIYRSLNGSGSVKEKKPLLSSKTSKDVVGKRNGKADVGQETPIAEEGASTETGPFSVIFQSLKTREVYILCMTCNVQYYAFFVLNTHYKAFGLVYIPDDHFLTWVVMAKCFLTPVTTWLAGMSFDRIGVKITIVVICSLLSIMASIFYLTVFNKWVYLLSCTIYGCNIFTSFCLLSSCCLKIYGQKKFTVVFGFISSVSGLVTLIYPPLTEWIVVNYSWFPLFISVGFATFVNFFILVLFYPADSQQKTY